ALAEMNAIMDEDFIWFAYAGDRPVGCLFALPDANEILRDAGDPSHVAGKLKFIFYKHLRGFSRVRVVAMGVVPDFQNRGLESALIMKAYEAGKKKSRYKHVELSWVGDFNDKMLAIHRAMGATQDKQHATFRKVL
ncbi:MAG TPA: GNAT family N-acetyltransferase, partial [Chryseosolibacter sp.]